jgi:hypothetical protein
MIIVIAITIVDLDPDPDPVLVLAIVCFNCLAWISEEWVILKECLVPRTGTGDRGVFFFLGLHCLPLTT